MARVPKYGNSDDYIHVSQRRSGGRHDVGKHTLRGIRRRQWQSLREELSISRSADRVTCDLGTLRTLP